MDENNPPRQRPEPFFDTPAFKATQQPAAVENTAKPSSMQQTAAAPQAHSGVSTEEKNYSVSVDQVRERLVETGVQKSKDSIQRYCREGRLDCKKLGIRRHYYVTETSVKKLVSDFSKRENLDPGMQVHAAAGKVHAPSEDKADPENIELRAGATTPPQEALQVHETALVAELHKQINDKDKVIEFLQDELVDRREVAKALTKVIDAFQNNSAAALKSAENEEEKLRQTKTPVDVEVVATRQAGEGHNPHPNIERDDV